MSGIIREGADIRVSEEPVASESEDGPLADVGDLPHAQQRLQTHSRYDEELKE
ncbi:MAG: hypothetical protein M3397_06560 [Actinomycetota bacterium]|nr:hypothetical protein [Rubrobacter sp.]MBA3790321.1 hypothetical protein [Rubrobacter sp.]MDQ3237840.1 hypothetical protein [Actinomycetota bacterium]MDQ3567728.1 hypothetical protein [Actinomycetota bacterium]